jgi:hypothetical protein
MLSKLKNKFFLVLVLLIATPAICLAASAGKLVAEGNAAYDKGQFDEALGKYGEAGQKVPESAVIPFNRGNALYKKGDFAASITEFEKVIHNKSPRQLVAKSKYNMGNATFRMAEQQLAADPQAALGSLKKSVSFYQQALQDDATLQEAARNVEVAKVKAFQVQELMKQLDKQAQENQKQQKEAEDKLKQLIKEQESQAEQSKQAANDSAKMDQSAKAKKGDDLAEDQKKTKQESEQLADKLAEMGPQQSSVKESTQKAVENQQSAAENLEKGDFNGAHGDQQKALDNLQKALSELEKSKADDQKAAGEKQDKKEGAGKNNSGNEKQGKEAEPEQQKQAQQAADLQDKEAPDATAKDILNQEKANKQVRQLQRGASGYSRVEKDW